VEAAKGILVLLLGFGVLTLVHRDLHDVASQLTRFFHANPEGSLAHLFSHVANRATDKTLWVLALGALLYATVRFVEAYGLWHERDWAEWFALLSGALYLPGELYSLIRHPRPLKWGVVVANVIIVLYMLMLRVKARKNSGQWPVASGQ
jgi:uncharacterized membrane protein (DUF2068 family)